jgi:hypothetical protein
MMRPEPRTAQAAMAAAVALASAAGAFFAPHAARADSPPSAAECRAMTDFTKRGECWDALDRAGLHDEQVVKKRSFGLGLHPPSVAAIAPPKAKKEKVVNPDAADVKSLTLTIASIGDSALGHIILTATNGAVWEQTDTDAINDRPAPGDTFEVTKGMFGSYMCHVTRWQPVRCQRDQ